jgi:SAM-dependent methyltransferase
LRTKIKSSVKSAFRLLSMACRALGLTKFQSRDGFTSRPRFMAALRANGGSILEIGPFHQPFIRGSNVKYFDLMDQRSLIARARELGHDPGGCPFIHYVSASGDLGVITEERFDSVVSSHCIEHQPDLIRHLNQVHGVLRPGGRYYLIVPDQRFCFDHYLPPSRSSEVLAAHVEARAVHTPAAIIAHYAETTHNNALRHWIGFHRPPNQSARSVERLRSALALIDPRGTGYLDVHGWFFTPSSFQTILDTLAQMHLIGFRIDRVYGTSFGSSEFFAVLRSHPAP